MKEELIKELISYHKDLKNNFWAGLIVSLSGSLGLTFTEINTYKTILIAAGIIFSLVFITGYFNHYIAIRELIKHLRKEK